jgi:hypothetical protein
MHDLQSNFAKFLGRGAFHTPQHGFTHQGFTIRGLENQKNQGTAK